MNTLTTAQFQQIHNAFFGCDATDRDILRYLKEAEETLVLCKEEVTPEGIEELLVLWFQEEQMEADEDWSNRSRLMLDDA
jgi:hypothetical protein